jgi:hypothetical protein
MPGNPLEIQQSRKKELGIDRQDLTNREKTQLVDALRPTYAVAELLCEVGLPRSSYFYHRARLLVADRSAWWPRRANDVDTARTWARSVLPPRTF